MPRAEDFVAGLWLQREIGAARQSSAADVMVAKEDPTTTAPGEEIRLPPSRKRAVLSRALKAHSDCGVRSRPKGGLSSEGVRPTDSEGYQQGSLLQSSRVDQQDCDLRETEWQVH